ncbi:CPBP family intramembrane glutamic endopeptidase [Oceanicaulis alexandrii]|uniref:CPBP family intramembrane glutamic endopeptidase n=1 Tax=Oceanicaulis alexandrii TaxID=153233 RepID=UPI0004009BD3|nr:CPBP family intramembrane glutamic endopeptidase [Oceanicaulis alexandrii]
MPSPSSPFPSTTGIWEAISAEPALSAGFAAILIAFIYAEISTRAARRRTEAGATRNTLKTMTETILMLWMLGSVCLVCWMASGRDLAGLGLILPNLSGPEAWRGWLSWAAAIALTLFLLSQLLPLRTQEGREAMAKALSGMEGVDMIQPRTPVEHRRFQLMAFSAGWNEEIIFRGFLMGALALYLPLWIAALASMIIFIGFHTYQGVSGMIRIIPITIGMTGLVVLSGSLWPAIVVHVAADVVGGLYLYLSQPSAERLSRAAP